MIHFLRLVFINYDRCLCYQKLKIISNTHVLFRFCKLWLSIFSLESKKKTSSISHVLRRFFSVFRCLDSFLQTVTFGVVVRNLKLYQIRMSYFVFANCDFCFSRWNLKKMSSFSHVLPRFFSRFWDSFLQTVTFGFVVIKNNQKKSLYFFFTPLITLKISIILKYPTLFYISNILSLKNISQSFFQSLKNHLKIPKRRFSTPFKSRQILCFRNAPKILNTIFLKRPPHYFNPSFSNPKTPSFFLPYLVIPLGTCSISLSGISTSPTGCQRRLFEKKALVSEKKFVVSKKKFVFFSLPLPTLNVHNFHPIVPLFLYHIPSL